VRPLCFDPVQATFRALLCCHGGTSVHQDIVFETLLSSAQDKSVVDQLSLAVKAQRFVNIGYEDICLTELDMPNKLPNVGTEATRLCLDFHSSICFAFISASILPYSRGIFLPS